ncbi:MAG TPA: SAM-dependent methyltransferase [Flavobacteriaceae bacterium]|nr:SAM-dependent methyltransferase [Flavobacteriaceae bacterium]
MKVNKDLFGQALCQFYFEKDSAKLYSETNISRWDEYPLDYLFRDFDQMPQLERKALTMAKGKILDVGCGVGSHSLHLQNQECDVWAIDSSFGATSVAKARGVNQVAHASLLDYNEKNFDTILMLMNGTGIFESLESVAVYLDHLKTLLSPDGIVLIDSSDLKYMYDPGPDGAIWVPANRYYGALEFRLRYKKQLSEKFPWLFIDQNLFADLAQTNGWSFEIITKGEHYDFLAQLKPFKALK